MKLPGNDHPEPSICRISVFDSTMPQWSEILPFLTLTSSMTRNSTGFPVEHASKRVLMGPFEHLECGYQVPFRDLSDHLIPRQR